MKAKDPEVLNRCQQILEAVADLNRQAVALQAEAQSFVAQVRAA